MIEIFISNEIYNQDEITRETAKGAEPGKLYEVRVTDNNMEPEIQEEDIVFIKAQSDVESREIAALFIGNESLALKKIKKLNEGIMLLDLNPNIEPRFYSNERIRQLPITIFGRVTEMRRNF